MPFGLSTAKGRALLLLVILLPPLALYLVILGWLNRRQRPVMMGGPWEFAGVLFALSGVLVVGGPALIASVDEQSRWFWLLGETDQAGPISSGAESHLGRPSSNELGGADSSGGSSDLRWTTTLWTAVRLLYIVVVAAGAGLILWRSRRLTSICNVPAGLFFNALQRTFQRLGWSTVRTGDSFQITGRLPEGEAASKDDRIQVTPPPASVAAGSIVNTTLHVDIFAAMRHVTLRWDPSSSPMRREVENELKKTLGETALPDQEPIHGGCLSLVGVTLFALALVAGAFLILLRFYPLH